MFDVEYKGGNTIMLSSKKATIVTDPRLSVIGLKDSKVANCVELVTEERFIVDDDNAKLPWQRGTYVRFRDWPDDVVERTARLCKMD